MKNIFLKLSINVVLVFVTVMALSIIPEEFPKLFGDRYCMGSGTFVPLGSYSHIYDNCNYGTYHDAEWHWGYRHWLWLFMGIFLFIIQVVRIIIFINNSTKTTK